MNASNENDGQKVRKGEKEEKKLIEFGFGNESLVKIVACNSKVDNKWKKCSKRERYEENKGLLRDHKQ